MNEVDRWLRRQAAREQRGMLLEQALLGDRLWDYTRYRLRYFFAKYLVETAVHTVTVLFLFRELRWGTFVPIVVAHAVTSLAASVWWGALEALRARVRDLHRSGRPHRIERVIGGWLTLALLAAAGMLALALVWLAWHAVRGTLGAAAAYVGVLLLRLAVDVPTRCYHSGVYALRRVYKPLPAVLGAELLELATILVLWPFAGLWAVVAASLLVTAALTAVTLRYTSRVYRFIGFAPQRQLGLPNVRPALRGAGREALLAGGANGVIALDSLVVLALLYGAATSSEALVVLFLAGPSIRAGADWARLFYFDLKRLELRLFTNLRARFQRHTARLAWMLGLLFWALAAATATVFYGGDLRVPYVALLAFFLARSLLARVQVQAFADGAYRQVVATGAVLLVGLAAATVRPASETARLTAVALGTAACALVLSRLQQQAAARGEPGSALLTLEWLRRLGQEGGAVHLGSARLVPADGPARADARTREEQERWRLAQVAERTARRLGDRGAAAWVGPDRVVWFERGQGRRTVTPQWLQVVTGGLLGSVDERDCATGEDALLVAGRDSLLGFASPHLLTAVLPVDVAAARRRFAELLPDGFVYAPDGPVAPQLAALPGAELRAILVDAVSFARDLRVGRRRSRSDVTALCAGGELRLIFVAALGSDKRARRRWHQQVARLNVRAAVAGAAAADGVRAIRLHVPERVVRLGGRLRHDGALPLVDDLRRVPLLSGLSNAELRRVAATMTERTFEAGELITREGEAGVGFFVIEEGTAVVSVRGVERATLHGGDHFGEIALVAETPRTATVTALTPLRCRRMTSWEFRRLIERSPSISWQVLQSTARLLYEARALPPAAGNGDGSGVAQGARR